MTITVKEKFFMLEYFIFLLNEFWGKNFSGFPINYGKTDIWGKKILILDKRKFTSQI